MCGFVRDFLNKLFTNNKKQRIAKNKQHKTTKSGGNIYYENFGI